MTQHFNINDFVWAKLQRYPPWPALVVEPGPKAPNKPAKLKNANLYWVYFFGTHNYCWIQECDVKDYREYKEKYVSLYNTISFKESVVEINKHIEKSEKDPNYRVKVEPIKTKVNKKKRSRVELDKLHAGGNASVDFQISKKPKTDVPGTNLQLGIIGIEYMGRKIIKSLAQNGYQINIWNISSSIYEELLIELGTDAAYLKCCSTPRSVLLQSNIVFMCISDNNVSKNILLNIFGFNDIMQGKGLIEMGGIGPKHSKDLSVMVEGKGGRYLEVTFQEGHPDICRNKMLLLAAGNNELFMDCQPYFRVISFKAVYLGDVGKASQLNLIIQMLRGVLLAGLAEGWSLGERSCINKKDLRKVLKCSSLNCKYLTRKSKNIIYKNYVNSEQSLQHLYNDLKLGLELSNEMQQPMMLTASAEQVFRHCVNLGFGNNDPAIIFMRNRH